MNQLSIKIITWNMGKSTKKISDWMSELQTLTVIEPGEDIIFISVQESTNKIGDEYITLFLSQKLDQYEIIHKGRGTDTIGLSYCVYGYLCVKKCLSPTFINRPKDMIGTYKNLCCTKVTLGFGLQIGQIKLILVCSHLPVDFSDKYLENWGYGERVQTMLDVEHSIIDDLIDVMCGNTCVFWAGDLNFRIQTDGTEQLHKLLSHGFGRYHEADKHFLQTNKLTEYDPLKDDFKTFIKRRKSNRLAYNLNRIPSYCDRIIFRGQFTPVKYYSWPSRHNNTDDTYPLCVAYSDHEPVILEGLI